MCGAIESAARSLFEDRCQGVPGANQKSPKSLQSLAFAFFGLNSKAGIFIRPPLSPHKPCVFRPAGPKVPPGHTDLSLLPLQIPTPNLQTSTPDLQISIPDLKILTPHFETSTPDLQISMPSQIFDKKEIAP